MNINEKESKVESRKSDINQLVGLAKRKGTEKCAVCGKLTSRYMRVDEESYKPICKNCEPKYKLMRSIDKSMKE